MKPVVQTGLDLIYNDPYTAYALDLSERFAKNSLNEKDIKDFLDTLPPAAARERIKLERVLANSGGRVEADLSTREGQLVWNAGLGFVAQNSKPGAVRSHPIWNILTRNPQLSGSLGAAARYVDLSITNRNATMDWGTPGSWFWYSPDINHINIDLFQTLLIGFGKDPAPGMRGMAHAIGVMMHEIGHSQLTLRFTDAMIALKERETALMADTQSRKLSPDEFKQLLRIRTEFKLRMSLMNAAEDNCVNRYAANQGLEFPHDFSNSLNIGNVILQGTGAYLKAVERGELPLKQTSTPTPKQQEFADAQEGFDKLTRTLAMAFYATNGLFEMKDAEAWNKLGIDPASMHGMSGNGFNELMEQCVGVNGLANLQPVARDRWLLRTLLTRSLESYAEKRCKLIDDIWDKYAAPYAEALINAVEEKAENQLNQQSEDQQNSDEPSPPQEGDGQSGNGEPQDSDAQSVEVEGAGKQNTGNKLPSTPEEARKASRQQSEQELKADDAKTVRDLSREAKQQERENKAANSKDGKEQKEGAKAAENEAANGESPGNGGSEGRKEVDLAKLSSGDWKEFRKRLNELEPVISRITDDFTYIRDQQKQIVRSLSKENEQLPRSGNLRQRLDMRAHMNLAAKRATGQKIEEADLRRWKKDQVETEPTSVELWILGDGSGSTRRSLADGGRIIDSCLQTMAILQEAGKRASFDVYAGIWEDHGVRMLAEPGYAESEIGKNFDAIAKSGGVGTIYNTPIPEIIDRLAHQTTDGQGRAKRFAGMTHFLWILDGTRNDLEIKETAAMLAKLFRYGPAVSIDIAYLGGHRECETKEIVALVKQAVPGAAIDTLEALNAKDAPLRLVRKIKSRFEQAANGVKAVPDRVKREAFSSVSKALKSAHL